MAICTVSGQVVDVSGTALSGATVRFRTVRPVLDAANSLVVPMETSTTTAVDGTWALSMDRGISGMLSFDFPQSSTAPTARFTYSVTIPSTATATFASLVVVET